MAHKRFRGHYLAVAFLALATFLVSAFGVLAAPSVAADTTCSWTDTSTVTCDGETYNTPTVNSNNTITLHGGNAQAGNEATGCPADNIVVSSPYKTSKSGKLTTYKATATGKFSTACTSTVSNATLTNTYSTPGTGAASTATTSAPADNNTGSTGCGSGDWDWVICPANKLLQTIGQGLVAFINEQLTINTTQLFGTNCNAKTTGNAQCSASQAYYKAWNTFRILGTGLIVIGGLIMVSSQALGFELLDAYTVRKVLPRLLVAVIAMSLSWPLLSFIINFFNEAGRAVQALIYAPFSGLQNHDQLTAGFLSWGLIVAAIGGIATGYGAIIFPLLGTGMLALLIGLLILIIRQIAVTLIVILAPFAIAAYVLPNTQKIWKIWYDNFLGLMLMFPIMTGMIAAGQVFSAVGDSGNTVQQLVGIVAWFVPFFLIPVAFRIATGFISTIAGFVNDRSKGGFDRLRGARQKQMEHANEHNGRRILAGRAAAYNRLQKAGSEGGFAKKRAARGLARVVGGRNLHAVQSAKQAAVQKEIDDIKNSGNDDEVRALNARKILERDAAGNLTGGYHYESLAGKRVSEASYLAAHQRWGHDRFAQQASLTYEMSKASSEDELKGIEDNYLDVAQHEWHMSAAQATEAHIGAGFGNQGKHRELKHERIIQDKDNAGNVVGQHMGLDIGNLNGNKETRSGYDNFSTDMYENIGSYSAAQMNSATINKLTSAWDEAQAMESWAATAKSSAPSGSDQWKLADAREKQAGTRKKQLQAIGETFMQEYNSGQQMVYGDQGQPVGMQQVAPPAQAQGQGQLIIPHQQGAQQPQTTLPQGPLQQMANQAQLLQPPGTGAAGGRRQANTAGAGSIAERVVEFTKHVGVYDSAVGKPQH